MSKNDIQSRTKPYLIGIAGGSGSGKTSIANIIFKYLGVSECLLFSMDTYYKDLTEEQQKNISEYNFDHPDALDFELLNSHINSLMNWESINMPTYDFNTSSRGKETKKLYPNKIIIFEGILAFHDKRIRDLMDIKIFVDLDGDIRLSRRIYRDIIDRGREMKTVINRYHKFVKPAFEIFIKPTRKFADIIIPKGAENTNAIDMIAQQLKNKSKILFPNGIKNFIKKSDLIEKNCNKNCNKNLFKKEEIFNLNNNDLFDEENKIDVKILKKIFIDFLLKKNSGYYLLYSEIIINNLINLIPNFNKDSSYELLFYSNLDEDQIKIKLNNSLINSIIIFIPFLLNENSIKEKLLFLENILKNNIKNIYLASIFITLDIKNNIINKYHINVISVYCGNKLNFFSNYIEKGGFIGNDSEGEIDEKFFIFSERKFEETLINKYQNKNNII